MSIDNLVVTLLEKLQQVGESTDWRGEVNWQYLRSNSRCWRCGGEFGKDIETGSHVIHHIVPSSEGGRDSSDNRSLLCGNCHNVVHRFYLPTGKIGKKRTREGEWRRVVEFEEGISISQNLYDENESLSSCRNCRSPGIVEGVSEGYWGGKGMMVFLSCSDCESRFAVPFIVARNAPEVDGNAVLFQELDQTFEESAEKLPSDLALRVILIGRAMVSEVRDCIYDLQAAKRVAAMTGVSEAELKLKTDSIRQQHINALEELLPEAAKLQVECKKEMQV